MATENARRSLARAKNSVVSVMVENKVSDYIFL